jgi:NAD(P)-dependent dehydrogenase (short-subunit alcohol dehydrogenase family)
MADKRAPSKQGTPAPGTPPEAPASVKHAFDLSGRVAVITGGAGLLGTKHAEAVIELGGVPVLLDLNGARAKEVAAQLAKESGGRALGLTCDITSAESVEAALAGILSDCGRVDILINNAANNPKVEGGDMRRDGQFTRLENFPLDIWNQDLAVGLTGAFLCSRVFGAEMARRGKGVILNIASDLAVIGPDQRLYRQPGVAPHQQPVKPVTYSVVKAGLLGLTRYLATYWPEQGVRCNALLPGGVYDGQDADFLSRFAALVPMGRMAHRDEYKGAVAFLVSDASSYMNGAIISADGGRTAW